MMMVKMTINDKFTNDDDIGWYGDDPNSSVKLSPCCGKGREKISKIISAARPPALSSSTVVQDSYTTSTVLFNNSTGQLCHQHCPL